MNAHLFNFVKITDIREVVKELMHPYMEKMSSKDRLARQNQNDIRDLFMRMKHLSQDIKAVLYMKPLVHEAMRNTKVLEAAIGATNENIKEGNRYYD